LQWAGRIVWGGSMTKPLDVQAAEWLIVGFNKSWSMDMLSIRLFELGGTHFDFMPTSKFWYGKCPVRGFVAQNYPKLNAFLNDAPIEKQLKAASEIIKLRPSVERPDGALNSKERNDIAKTRKELRASTTSYRESRKNFKAHSMHNWNVCK